METSVDIIITAPCTIVFCHCDFSPGDLVQADQNHRQNAMVIWSAGPKLPAILV